MYGKSYIDLYRICWLTEIMKSAPDSHRSYIWLWLESFWKREHHLKLKKKKLMTEKPQQNKRWRCQISMVKTRQTKGVLGQMRDDVTPQCPLAEWVVFFYRWSIVCNMGLSRSVTPTTYCKVLVWDTCHLIHSQNIKEFYNRVGFNQRPVFPWCL